MKSKRRSQEAKQALPHLTSLSLAQVSLRSGPSLVQRLNCRITGPGQARAGHSRPALLPRPPHAFMHFPLHLPRPILFQVEVPPLRRNEVGCCAARRPRPRRSVSYQSSLGPSSRALASALGGGGGGGGRSGAWWWRCHTGTYDVRIFLPLPRSPSLPHCPQNFIHLFIVCPQM